MYSGADTYLTIGGFPHSEIPGSKLVCQLPEAYRRLPRPSSPSVAKASTICAYSLDHITPKSLESYVYCNDTVYLESSLKTSELTLLLYINFRIFKEQ